MISAVALEWEFLGSVCVLGLRSWCFCVCGLSGFSHKVLLNRGGGAGDRTQQKLNWKYGAPVIRLYLNAYLSE